MNAKTHEEEIMGNFFNETRLLFSIFEKLYKFFVENGREAYFNTKKEIFKNQCFSKLEKYVSESVKKIN